MEDDNTESSDEELDQTVVNEHIDTHHEASVIDVLGDDIITDISELGVSVDNISLFDTNHSVLSNDVEMPDMLKLFGFSKFQVPPLLCRHPPPVQRFIIFIKKH